MSTAIDVGRLTRLLALFVDTPSFPGEETAMAHLFAQELSDAGALVELNDSLVGSPSVIGTLGEQHGAVLQLAGHLDTIPVPHPPARLQGARMYARGACDMKAGLAAMVETVRVLAARPSTLRGGGLLITAYGLHEGPGAYTMHAALQSLLERGVHGDSVIVCEGPEHVIPIAGRGSLIFNIAFERPNNGPSHELLGDHGPHPLMAAHRFISLLSELSDDWATTHPTLGPESFFVGRFSSGDTYNTIPLTARIEGTRRYPPPVTFESVVSELERICARVEQESGISVLARCERSGQPFEMSGNERIIQCIRSSHQTVTGSHIDTGVQQFASDINHFVGDYGIPGAAYGVSPRTAHSTPEYVSIPDLVTMTEVLVDTVQRYHES